MSEQEPLFEQEQSTLGLSGRAEVLMNDRSEFIDGIMAAWDAAHPEEAAALERERLRRLEKAEADAALLRVWKRQYER